jgi:uncharacterized protein involved in exopolysaccharide biosynthesis
VTDGTNRPDPNLGWPPQEEMGGSINLLEYVNMLLRRRWLIVVGTLLTVLAAGIYLKRQTPMYQASIRILPSREQAMSSRIDQSFGMNRGGQQQGYEQADLATQYYQELITSFPFLEKIVRKKFRLGSEGNDFDLIEYYKVNGVDEADKVNKATVALRKSMNIMIPRSTAYGAVRTMAIGVVADNPIMAASIPNAILDELMIYNQDVRVTRSSENRRFIEDQIKTTQDLLTAAENAFAVFQKGHSLKTSPEGEVERDRLKRNITVQTEVYIQLKKQLELAKIEEMEKRPTIEILERAMPPQKKFKPVIRKGVMMAGFLGLFAFCGLAFVLEMAKKFNKDDEHTKEFIRNIEGIKNDAAKVGRLVGLGKKKRGVRP